MNIGNTLPLSDSSYYKSILIIVHGKEREKMGFEEFITLIKDWGELTDEVSAIILVGSYARGTYKPTSDIDFVILTTEKDELVSKPDIFNRFGKAQKINVEHYGVVTSIRIWYEDSFEVEYGITDIDWISIPLDSGTHRTLNDGYRVIVDKLDCFSQIEL